MPIPKPGEEPKPGEKSKPRIPGIPIPGGKIPLPIPLPIPRGEKPIPLPAPDGEKPAPGDDPEKASPHRAPAPMPPVVKKHFEARRGYANYYFNKLHRERLWKAWNALANLTSFNGVWTFAGEIEDGRAYGFTFSDLVQRLLPAIALEAYPDGPIRPDDALAVAQRLVPTPPFREESS